MRTAVVFAGQGSQVPGYGEAWRDDAAWSVVARADEVLGDRRGSALLLEADAEALAPTDAAQVAVLLSTLVAWHATAARLTSRCEVIAMAGHSLGQLTALIAAGVLELDDGLRFAAARAAATARAQDECPGAMLALFPVTRATAEEVVGAATGRAWVANDNGARQVVLGVRADAVDEVAAVARGLGIRRVERLAVGGAFHTPLMESARAALVPLLDELVCATPHVPVVTNHDARPVADADGWPDRLGVHLVRPVEWGRTMATLVELGVEAVVEVGPRSRLAALLRRERPELEVRVVTEPADLEALW